MNQKPGTDNAAWPLEQLRELTDRAAITRLCDRYTMHLDADRDNDEWLGSVFTPDAHLTFPFGEYQGLAGLAEFQQMARTTFARTHHLSSNYSVDLDGDKARVRAHLMAVHVPRSAEPGLHFTIGGHYDAQAVRTPDGWRIRQLVFDLVWNAGQAPGGKPPA
jgi:hypothetical protein